MIKKCFKIFNSVLVFIFGILLPILILLIYISWEYQEWWAELTHTNRFLLYIKPHPIEILCIVLPLIFFPVLNIIVLKRIWKIEFKDKTIMKRFARELLGFVIKMAMVAGIYCVINLIWLCGQKLWHQEDRATLELLREELYFEEEAYNNTQEKLDGLIYRMQQIKPVGPGTSLFKRTECLYSSGIPAERVDEHNSILQSYNKLNKHSASQIDVYNLKSKQAGALERKINSTWYVFPFPIPRFGSP